MSAINIRTGLGANSVKRRSLSTASSAALMMLAASGAYAQDTGTETVTVSSTRIMNADFVSATPTTAIGAADLVKQANTNVFATVTQLPSLQGSTGSSVGNGGSSNGVNGLSALNLRNIGTNRNLVLVDGERVVPASIQGVVDISQLPQMLISRVDVVTGGASASWGSDAVTGVVNFILDKKFEGFKANISGGLTTYADDPQAQFQFAAGSSMMGGRLHWEVSGEFTSEAGVDSLAGPRTWYQNPQQLQMYSFANCTTAGNACVTSKAPMFMNVNQGVLAQWSTGGLITRGPLQGTAFGANGSTYQFNYGSGFGVTGTTFGALPAVPVRGTTTSANALLGPVTSNTVTNCSGGGYCFGGDTSGNQTGYASMVARLVRGDAFTRVGFDLTPNIEIYFTGMWSEVFTWDKPTQSFFKNDNLEAGCDDPFLPAVVVTTCFAQNGNPAGNFPNTNPAVAVPTNAAYGQPAATGSAYIYNLSTVLQQTVPGANNWASFPAGRIVYGEQNLQLKSVENYNDRQLGRLVLGTDGNFTLFGIDWNFKGYIEHGENHYFNMLENILSTPYYNAAIDAVGITSANQSEFWLHAVPTGWTDFSQAGLTALPTLPIGSVICRSPQARAVGCAPADLFGLDALSTSGQQFIQGAPNGSVGANTGRQRWPWQVVHQRQEVFDYGMSGDVLEDWAGKISAFVGFQYREEAFNARSDCASQGNCPNQTWGGLTYGPAGNPILTPATALGTSGVVVPLAPTPNYYAGNFQQGRGNFHEYEASTEINVPLLNDPQWGRANLDLAGRETVYSTSGWVSTWKVGLTWDTPVDGLRLRALQSRDVRAPNLAELFGAPRVNNGSVTDDFSVNGGPVNQSVSPLPNPIVGNPALKPERGATTELGVVYSPDWFPGLNTSVTYYRIAVKGEVANFSQQQQMDACYNGGSPGATAGSLAQCAFFYSIVSGSAVSWVQGGALTTLPTTTTPNGQISQLFNVASVVTDGFDYEVDYRFVPDDIVDWGIGGNVTLRALATNVSKFVTNPGISGVPIIQTAGSNSSSVPHWKTFFTESYDTDRWGFFLNERWFSTGYINHNWVACTPGSCPSPVDGNHPTANSNYMPGEFYLDVGGHFDVTPMTSLWFKIDNVANQSPDGAYSYTPANQSYPMQPTTYDVLGRFYHIGIRIND